MFQNKTGKEMGFVSQNEDKGLKAYFISVSCIPKKKIKGLLLFYYSPNRILRFDPENARHLKHY